MVFILFVLSHPYPQVDSGFECVFFLIYQIALDFNLFVLSYPYPPVDIGFSPVYSFLSTRLHWFLTC